ncbi:MAG: pyridoxamine 5'-phosphate oxidase family protein, partial [Actinomycetota bacterium]
MYRSWGNVLVNPRVGLLFLDFERPMRMRVNGTAEVRADDPLRDESPGSVFIVRVTAERIFPNCPRYVHTMRLVEHSVYAPRPDYTPPFLGGSGRKGSGTRCRSGTGKRKTTGFRRLDTTDSPHPCRRRTIGDNKEESWPSTARRRARKSRRRCGSGSRGS